MFAESENINTAVVFEPIPKADAAAKVKRAYKKRTSKKQEEQNQHSSPSGSESEHSENSVSGSSSSLPPRPTPDRVSAPNVASVPALNKAPAPVSNKNPAEPVIGAAAATVDKAEAVQNKKKARAPREKKEKRTNNRYMMRAPSVVCFAEIIEYVSVYYPKTRIHMFNGINIMTETNSDQMLCFFRSNLKLEELIQSLYGIKNRITREVVFTIEEVVGKIRESKSGAKKNAKKPDDAISETEENSDIEECEE